MRIKTLRQLETKSEASSYNLAKSFVIWKEILKIAASPDTQNDELESALLAIAHSFNINNVDNFFAIETFLEFLIYADNRTQEFLIKLLKDYRPGDSLSSNFGSPNYQLRKLFNNIIYDYAGDSKRVFKHFLWPTTDISKKKELLKVLNKSKTIFKQYFEARTNFVINLIPIDLSNF